MKLRLALLSCALLATACVDNGNKLEKLRFTTTSDYTVPLTPPLVMFECFPQLPTLIGEFTDGSLGDFTQRGAKYTSSNPAELEVSNGDVPFPGSTGFYPRGSLIPHTVTTTPVTITGSFAGLTATTTVEVHASGTLTVAPSSTVANAANPYLAPGSVMRLVAMTTWDGRPTDVSSIGQWTFTPTVADPTPTDPTDDVASVGLATGLLSGFKVGDGTVTYSLPACAASASTQVTLPVNVAIPTSIAVTRQFPGQPVLFSTAQSLFTTDAITTIVGFAGGQHQDLSFQAQLKIDTVPTGTTVDTFTVNDDGTNRLRAFKEGLPVSLTATYPPVDSTGASIITAMPTPLTVALGENVTAKEATLQSLAISPANQQVAGFGNLAFSATGTFADVDDSTHATLLTQDVTRHVLWESSDTTVALASNSYGLEVVPQAQYGVLTSLKNETGCVTVTADSQKGDPNAADPALDIVATTLLGVNQTPPCTPTTTPTP